MSSVGQPASGDWPVEIPTTHWARWLEQARQV